MAKDFLFDILQKELEGAETGAKGQEIGRVVSVGDGVVQIEGLPNAMFSEMVEIGEASVPAMILNLEEYTVGAVVLGQDTKIAEGDLVKRTRGVLSVPVGEALLGRVVNPLGVALDGKGSIASKEQLPIERPAPAVMDRQPVNTPLATGIKVVDATRPICIYVAIGQKASKVAQFVEELQKKGAMDYTIVVAASASDPAPLWYIAPYAGCSMGE